MCNLLTSHRHALYLSVVFTPVLLPITAQWPPWPAPLSLPRRSAGATSGAQKPPPPFSFTFRLQKPAESPRSVPHEKGPARPAGPPAHGGLLPGLSPQPRVCLGVFGNEPAAGLEVLGLADRQARQTLRRLHPDLQPCPGTRICYPSQWPSCTMSPPLGCPGRAVVLNSE